MKSIASDLIPAKLIPNVATMLKNNHEHFPSRIVFKEVNEEGNYQGISWEHFYEHIEHLSVGLSKLGMQPGDKVVLFSPNCLKMLEMELAIMSMGCIAVPIFAFFKQETADLLINHSDAKYLVVKGEKQLSNLDNIPKIQKIIALDNVDLHNFPDLVFYDQLIVTEPDFGAAIDFELNPDEICLNMYTSGTMGIPKCVQLTHRNILSQQAALDVLWDLDENDRFLAYLPWHHSFGGIFELFTALSRGATYALEPSLGKDPRSILENWKKIKPTIFFSVPKVYQALFDLTRESKEAEDAFFNSGLKFIFTAAASLPERLSDEFEKRGIPVIEGWGLTETSPCCTLTDPGLKREPGVVGKPIPGVQIRIAEDDEIQVKGPNVMVSYYNNDEANEGVFTEDGWYRTGDVGTLTETGLKLIARKDRIFKLSNGEKVVPTDLESQIEKKCHYIQYAIITGNGEDHPVALLFPNKKLLDKPDYEISPEEGCYCPRNLNELGNCLRGCLRDANGEIKQKFSKIKSAAIINDELSLDHNTLTPSMKVAPKNVIEKYKAHLLNMYGDNVPVEEEVYVVELSDSLQKEIQKKNHTTN